MAMAGYAGPMTPCIVGCTALPAKDPPKLDIFHRLWHLQGGG